MSQEGTKKRSTMREYYLSSHRIDGLGFSKTARDDRSQVVSLPAELSDFGYNRGRRPRMDLGLTIGCGLFATLVVSVTPGMAAFQFWRLLSH